MVCVHSSLSMRAGLVSPLPGGEPLGRVGFCRSAPWLSPKWGPLQGAGADTGRPLCDATQRSGASSLSQACTQLGKSVNQARSSAASHRVALSSLLHKKSETEHSQAQHGGRCYGIAVKAATCCASIPCERWLESWLLDSNSLPTDGFTKASGDGSSACPPASNVGDPDYAPGLHQVPH